MNNSLLKRVMLVIVAGFSALNTMADEGMWLPLLVKRLNHTDMQKMGLKLTAEEIYSINNSSLKDAIVSLGGFCTGEMISPEGLMLTNHHCGFDAIQQHSSIQNDYLTDGFWAMKKEDELATPGLFARFLVRMENVTEKVLSKVDDSMTEAEREAKIKLVFEEIKKEASEGTNYSADVKSFFDGNEFYLFVYEIYNDVRLVGAPPSAIGKFGGDTDNWMWPRHTGDFSMFRVYMSPDGKPSNYSKDNVPYKPKHFLPISLNGIEESDFTMIMGYPGRTNRYLTSYGVKQAIEKDQPAIVKIREKRLNLMKQDMDASHEVRIQYASKYAQISNYYKYFQGQIRGVKSLHVYDKKKAMENDFQVWIAKDAELTKKYGEAIMNIEAAYAKYNEIILPMTYLRESVLGCEILSAASRFYQLEMLLNDPKSDKAVIEKNVNYLKSWAEDFYKDYNAPTDKKVTAALLQMYYKDIPVSQQAEIFRIVEKKYKGDFSKYAEYLFEKSMFADKAKVEKFLENPSAKALAKDPSFIAVKSVIAFSEKEISPKFAELNEKLSKGNRLFVDGLRKMQSDKSFYPNANSTMRLTYGKVGDYIPRDAVEYSHYTTIEGIIEKEDPSNDEFIVPAKLKDLYNKKDYGQYVDKNGDLVVAFISNNDITGGNSGSPVINAEGHLIGCAFDGNWEAMSGDIAFEPNLQRTISVDIRYVLFIIDKYAGATNLINEMKLVRSSPVKEETKAEMPN